MKFSLISDMHVNHPQPKTPYNLLEEIVVVAGDTSNGLEGLRFLQKLKNKGFDVLSVDGNHEHYSNYGQGRDCHQTTERFTLDYPSFVDKGDIWFLLRNGWYWVEDETAWYHYMNDGRYADVRASEVNDMATYDAKFMHDYLLSAKEKNKKVVVVTHTAPCEETLNPEFEGHFSNAWYWNPEMKPLLAKFKDTILVWCHGHTHTFADKIVDGVRVVCNPRGYPGENPGWKPFTVEV